MDTNNQLVQSKAGRLPWSNMALKRCTSTEHLWNRKFVSLTSPVCSEILLLLLYSFFPLHSNCRYQMAYVAVVLTCRFCTRRLQFDIWRRPSWRATSSTTHVTRAWHDPCSTTPRYGCANVFSFILWKSIYHVSKKLQNCFYQNIVKFPPILIFFGTRIVKMLKLCECMTGESVSTNYFLDYFYSLNFKYTTVVLLKLSV